jgi:hypothetical protein
MLGRTDRLRLARQFAFVEFGLRGSPKESAVRQPTQNLVNWGVTQGRYGFPDKCCPWRHQSGCNHPVRSFDRVSALAMQI